MPRFRIISEINANSKDEALANSSMSILIKAIKITGPKPRHKWTIEYNGRVLDTVKGSKKHCLNDMNYLKKSSNPTVNKRVYKVIQIPGT